MNLLFVVYIIQQFKVVKNEWIVEEQTIMKQNLRQKQPRDYEKSQTEFAWKNVRSKTDLTWTDSSIEK